MAQLRKLQVDWDTLPRALEDSSRDYNEYFLNTDTGEVAVVPIEFLHREGDRPLDEEAHEWEREMQALAKRVEDEEGGWARIPFISSHEAYTHMERFTETVEDERLRDLLDVALDGRGAFRRFRDVLRRFPDEFKRWDAFNDRLQREWALAWLHQIGVDAELVDPYPRPQNPD